MIEFCAETYGWWPEQTVERPWAQIVQLLEARAVRMERSEKAGSSHRKDDELVNYTNDLSVFGIGRG